MKTLQPYNKALVAFVGFLLTVLAPRFGAHLDFQYITGVLTVLGVLHVPNGVEQVLTDIAQGVDEAKALEQTPPAAPTQPSTPPVNPSGLSA